MAAIEINLERLPKKFRPGVVEIIEAITGRIRGSMRYQVAVWLGVVGLVTAGTGFWANSLNVRPPGGEVSAQSDEGRFIAYGNCSLRFNRPTALLSIQDTKRAIFDTGTTTSLDFNGGTHIKEVFTRPGEIFSITTEVFAPQEDISVRVYEGNISGTSAKRGINPITTFSMPSPCY